MLKWSKVDTRAKANSSPVMGDLQPFANPLDLKLAEIEVADYSIVGELNQAILNDKMVAFPANTGAYKWGIFSGKTSNVEGVFEPYPTLTITFSDLVDAGGITLVFYDSFPQELEISWYAGNILKSSKVFYPDQLNYFCSNKQNDFNKLVIVFKKAMPYRFLKLQEIYYGQIKIMDKREILSSRLVESLHEVANQIWINTLNCEFFALDEDFDMVRKPGDYDLIKTRQPVESMAGYGTFYIDSFEAKGNNLKMSLVDLLGIIGDITFSGGVYNTTFGNFISEIATAANTIDIFDGIHNGFDVPPQIATQPVVGWLKETTIRKALQDLCIATSVTLDTTRGEKIKFRKKSSVVSWEITDGEMLLDEKTSMNDFYTGVSVVGYQYAKNGVVEEIFKDTYTAGNYKYNFGEPYSDISISGGTLTAVNPNFVWFTVAGTAEVTLRGGKYTETQRQFSKNVTGLAKSEIRQVKEIKGNTLISFNQGQAVCDNYFDYFTKKYRSEFSMLEPKKVGEIVLANGVTGIVERQDIDLVTEITKAVIVGNG